jgi:hypothetical protein
MTAMTVMTVMTMIGVLLLRAHDVLGAENHVARERQQLAALDISNLVQHDCQDAFVPC